MKSLKLALGLLLTFWIYSVSASSSNYAASVLTGVSEVPTSLASKPDSENFLGLGFYYLLKPFEIGLEYTEAHSNQRIGRLSIEKQRRFIELKSIYEYQWPYWFSPIGQAGIGLSSTRLDTTLNSASEEFESEYEEFYSLGLGLRFTIKNQYPNFSLAAIIEQRWFAELNKKEPQAVAQLRYKF